MIRRAKKEDIVKIFALYQTLILDHSKLSDLNYQAEIQKTGFLLGLDTLESFTKLIDEAHEFLINEESGEIIGFLVADHREKYYDDEYKTWFDLEAKDIYYKSDKAMTIAIIGTDRNSGKKGIASALVQELEKYLKEKEFRYLYSIVSMAPVTNCPSILFHTKNGFRRIAMGRPRTLFGLDNYSAILLFKKL